MRVSYDYKNRSNIKFNGDIGRCSGVYDSEISQFTRVALAYIHIILSI